MSRIPTNVVKALHVCDFEDAYWAELHRLKHCTKRALYVASVNFFLFTGF